MKLRLLLASSALFLFVTEAGAQERQIRRVAAPPVRVEGTCAVLPMRLIDNIPVVEISLGGRPHLFAIDTGAAGHGRIKAELAEALGLARIGEARAPAPGGAVATRPVFGAPAIGFGAVTFHEAGLLAAPVIPGRTFAWDGILGMDMFGNATLTLDYGNGVAMVSQTPVEGGVPATFADGVPSSPVEVAGRTFTVHLDIGNGVAGLFLPEAEARALPLTGEPAERARGRTSFGEFVVMEAPLGAAISVGGYTLNWRQIGWPPPRAGGNLGSRALAGSVVRVDRRNGRVSIAASGAPPTC